MGAVTDPESPVWLVATPEVSPSLTPPVPVSVNGAITPGGLPAFGGQRQSRRRRAELPGYTLGMKTAISLPDSLFRSGDALAKRLGVSRSELYARALAEYVAKNRAELITKRLNALYAREDSRLDPAFAAAQSRALPREQW